MQLAVTVSLVYGFFEEYSRIESQTKRLSRLVLKYVLVKYKTFIAFRFDTCRRDVELVGAVCEDIHFVNIDGNYLIMNTVTLIPLKIIFCLQPIELIVKHLNLFPNSKCNYASKKEIKSIMESLMDMMKFLLKS